MEAKAKFEAAGLPTAKAALWKPELGWKTPYVLKPVAQGSSVGVFRVFSESDVAGAASEATEMGCEFMIEEMIVGAEFTVGVLGNEALPAIEIRPEGGFYDYQHKYTAGATSYLCPAPVSADLEKRLRELAVKAHRSLGCEVYSRVDFMVNADLEPYVLEVNTIPGMTETSLLPKAAAQAGMSYAQLCDRILKLSLEKNV
jgi:D-alanine-D-alanine ligase